MGAFLGGSLCIYVVGLVLALIGMWMTTPSRGDIERRQREITAAGSPVSLLDALTSSPPPGRRRPEEAEAWIALMSVSAGIGIRLPLERLTRPH